MILVPICLCRSHAIRWKCYIHSEHGELLYRTERLYSTSEEAIMGLYMQYRGLVVEYARLRRGRCSCYDGYRDGESEDEAEGYSEI